jgi:hypothetical protein
MTAISEQVCLIHILTHVPCEAQKLVFVSPENGLVQSDIDIEENMIKIDDDILLSITHNNKETALLFLEAI